MTDRAPSIMVLWLALLLGSSWIFILSSGLGCSGAGPKQPRQGLVEITASGYRTIKDTYVDGEAVTFDASFDNAEPNVTLWLSPGSHTLRGLFDGVPATVTFRVHVEPGFYENYVNVRGRPPRAR